MRSGPPSRSNPRVRVKSAYRLPIPATWNEALTYAPWVRLQGEAQGLSLKKASHMVDYVGNVRRWNPVYHLSVRGNVGRHRSCKRGECQQFGSPNSPHFYPTPSAPFVGVTFNALASMVPVLDRSRELALHKSTLKRATMQMPTDVSILNFLIELREGVRGIVPKLRRFKDLLGNLYLGWKFGVESFIRDVKALLTSWQRWQHRLKYLRRHNGLETWVRGFNDLKHESALVASDYQIPPDRIFGDQGSMPSSQGGTQTPAIPHVVYKLHVVPESVVGEIHANILVYYLINGLDTFWGHVDSLAAVLGLNNPFKVAWNAVPYTWLVEYFINVGPWLDKLAGQPFKDATIEIRAAWASRKVSFDVEVYAGRYLGNIDGEDITWFDSIPAGQYHVVEYNRYPGLVLVEEELVDLGLTDQQKLILLALAESRSSWDQARWVRWALRKWGPWLGGALPRFRYRHIPKDLLGIVIKWYQDRRRRPR